VSYSNKGSDDGPSPDLGAAGDRAGSGICESASNAESATNPSTWRVKSRSARSSARSALYYQRPGQSSPWEGGPTVIITPNLEMGNLLYNLYATRYPEAKKTVGTLRYPFFEPWRCRWTPHPEDIRLSVKASVLRMHKFGAMEAHSPRHVLPPLSRVGHQPGFHLDQDQCARGRGRVLYRELAALRRRSGRLRRQGYIGSVRVSQDIVLKALSSHGFAPLTSMRWPVVVACCAPSVTERTA